MNTRIRTTIIGLIAAGSFAAAIAPAVSQAQPIDRSGGVVTAKRRQLSNPCGQLTGNYNKAQETLLDALEEAKNVTDSVTEGINQTRVKEAEGAANLASIAAWEYGCFAASESAPPSVVAPVTVITSTPTVTTKPVVVKTVTLATVAG